MSILRELPIIAIRARADRTNKGCFTASLAEAAIVIGSRRIVSLEKLNLAIGTDGTENTPPGKFFNHLRRGIDALDLEVIEVIANPSFLRHCDNPDDQTISVRIETGRVYIPIPNVRVMAIEYKPKWFALHSELDSGSKRSTQRIQNLESEGWFTAAAIVFRRKNT